jgi:excisionase family DNA binding protein
LTVHGRPTLLTKSLKHSGPGSHSASGPPLIEPIAVTVAQASVLTGLSRSRIYELLGSGQLRAVKNGTPDRRLV